MFSPKCKLLFVLALFQTSLFTPVAWADENWKLQYSGVTTSEMMETINLVFKEKSMVPVGISFSDGKICFIFIKQTFLQPSSYFLQALEIDVPTERKKKAVQEMVEQGWFPMDLTFTDDEFIILYLKLPSPAETWDIVSSNNSLIDIHKKMEELNDHIITGLTLGGASSLLLVVKSAVFSVSRWTIVRYNGDHEKIVANMNSLIQKGYIPLGFEYKEKEATLCFLKMDL